MNAGGRAVVSRGECTRASAKCMSHVSEPSRWSFAGDRAVVSLAHAARAPKRVRATGLHAARAPTRVRATGFHGRGPGGQRHGRGPGGHGE
jgi:hypothetical protein